MQPDGNQAKASGFDRAFYEGDFKQQTANLAYTPYFNTALEARMHDPLASTAERFTAWLIRNSWGRGSFYVVKDDGKSPGFQSDAAIALKIDPRRISEVTNAFKSRGYLLYEIRILYPTIALLTEVQRKVRYTPESFTNPSPEFRLFLQEWQVLNTPDFSTLEKAREDWKVANTTVKKLERMVRSAFKSWRDARTATEKSETPGLPDEALKSVGINLAKLASSASHPDSPTPKRPTEPAHRDPIRALIYELGFTSHLADSQCDKTNTNLGGAPLDRLRAYAFANRERMKTPAVIANYAEDVGKGWKLEQEWAAEQAAAAEAEQTQKIFEWRRMANDPNEPEDVRADCRNFLTKLGVLLE